MLIKSKIDENWGHAKEIKGLLSRRTSLDKVFARICIPALITYESDAISKNTEDSEEFKSALIAELKDHHARFFGKELPTLRIHLFLVPLHKKRDLIGLLHAKLTGMQT